MQSNIVIASTTWWPLAARTAAAFGILGARVSAICPIGSPVAAVSSVHEVFRYSALAPVRSLAAALHSVKPDLVIPCDERAVAHLHELHASAPHDDFLRQLIERSLGDPAGYPITLSRAAALEIAASEGIPEPASRPLRSEADVRAWSTQRRLPAIVKADGSWGGAGVEVVENPDAAVIAFNRMSRPLATWRVAKFLFSNRDPFPVRGWLRRERPAVIGQDFVRGRAANIMVACWQGEVLATAGAVVLETAKEFGAATIIRPVTHDGMEAAATRLVRRLGMSGFCGIDFIIEDGTEKAWMIELNPRPTQLGHLPLCPTGTLVGVLLARLRGETLPVATQPTAARRTIAFFPQAWLADTDPALLGAACHDIPWTEPALVKELLRTPWDSRGPLARLTNLMMRRPDPGQVLADSFAPMQPPEPADDPSPRQPAGPVSARPMVDLDASAAGFIPSLAVEPRGRAAKSSAIQTTERQLMRDCADPVTAHSLSQSER